MIVLPNGEYLAVDTHGHGTSVIDRILSDGNVRSNVSSFLDKLAPCGLAIDPLAPGHPAAGVFVLQGEKAMVSRESSGTRFSFVASDAATTCLLVALVSDGMAWMAHFDEVTSEHSLECIDSAVYAMGTSAISVYLVGGFEDSKGLSRASAQRIVGHLNSMSSPLHLQLACILSLNTKRVDDGPSSSGRSEPGQSPICQSLVINLSTSTATPANNLIMMSDHRGPELPRRMAFSHCTSTRFLTSIFDPLRGLVVLPTVTVDLTPSHISHLLRILAIENHDEFLLSTSTSPSVEGVSFVPDVRSAYEWLISNQGIKLPPMEFEHITNEGWIERRPNM